MSSFTDANFVKKLNEINNTQQSIQTLSLWLIHHRKHSKTIVDVWRRELGKAKPAKKLVFIYLANDVIQNSKKKGPEFTRDFMTVLLPAIIVVGKEPDEKLKASVGRVLTIWGERGVYDKDFVANLHKQLGNPIKSTTKQTPAVVKPASVKPASVKPATVKPATVKPASSPTKNNNNNAASSSSSRKTPSKTDMKSEQPPSKKKKQIVSLKEEVDAIVEGKDPVKPDPEELMKRLADLETAASSDAAVREKIAALPPEVSDISHLEKITDRHQANNLSETVNEACKLLADYNVRLDSELQERREVAVMLRHFISTQKEQLAQVESKLMEHRLKLSKFIGIRHELKSHVQNLPDINMLPDGLAPLPSAGDLFSL